MAYKIQTHRMGSWEEIKVPFIVPTPNPYVVDLADLYDQGMEFPFADADKEQSIRQELLLKVQALRSVMRQLAIEEPEAYELDLTLNVHTRELLRRKALEAGLDRLATRLASPDW